MFVPACTVDRPHSALSFAALVLALVAAAAGSAPVAAQGTHLWTQSRLEEFEKGTPQGVDVYKRQTMVRAMLEVGPPEGVYVDNGRDYKKVAKGAAHACDLPEYDDDAKAPKGWWEEELSLIHI